MSNNNSENLLSNKKVLTAVIIVIILLVGFTIAKKIGPINGKLVCKYDNNSDMMNSSYTYDMSFKMKNVTRFETTEVIESSEKELLETYQTSLNELSKEYQKLKHYNVNMSIDGDKLIVKTIVDYDKIDMKKYLKIDGEKIYIKNNKLKVVELKKIYEKNGAKCTYSK